MKVLIATKNKGKIEKYSTILNKLGMDYHTLNDINLDIDIREDGQTTTENAIIKARGYYEKVCTPVLADDSGLIIDKLPAEKQPGIYVKRHNGKELSDDEILNLYSREIEKVGGESTGAFMITIAIIDNNGKIHIKETKHNRLFVSKPDVNRVPGYPLSSLVFDKESRMYMTEKKKKGIKIYEEDRFNDEYEFIKNVLKGDYNNEERKN